MINKTYLTHIKKNGIKINETNDKQTNEASSDQPILFTQKNVPFLNKEPKVELQVLFKNNIHKKTGNIMNANMNKGTYEITGTPNIV